ncbi:BROMI protein, partial [Amia calva]|nr:BROMI protein [Amia calva]
MSQLSHEDEAELQALLRNLLHSVKDRISAAPSVECAEEILLHLEETDEHFHNYEFIRYLQHCVESALGPVVEAETERCASGEGLALGSGQETLVHAVTQRIRKSNEYKQMIQSLKNTMMITVESLINKFEEDQLKKQEMHRKSQHEQLSSLYTDNCSDSDSSFNQSYTFIKQEQLQVIADKLDPSQPKEVRWDALQTLCCAPPSDVLSCESWSALRRSLCSALADADPAFSDKVLRFYAKTFSSSPLNISREIYTSLAKHLESGFLSQRASISPGAAGLDIHSPEVARLLKKMRLLNEFQKEVPSFWIRHPEKYMEEIIEHTLSLLSLNLEQSVKSTSSDKALEPIYFLSLLDIRATWFKKWMHGYYSRTVVLRLLENKYKSLIVASLQQCIHYFESTEYIYIVLTLGPTQRTSYSAKELQYFYFVHSLCLLGRLLMYTHGRRLFPIKVKRRKDAVTLTDLIIILIRIMYSQPKPFYSDASHAGKLYFKYSNRYLSCIILNFLEESWYKAPVIECLLSPIIALLKGKRVSLPSPETTLTHIADVLARIASTERGLSLFLYEGNFMITEGESISAAHVIVQFTKKLLGNQLPALYESGLLFSLKGAFIFVCRQMYNTCEGLQVLKPYGLHTCIADAWKKTSSQSERVPTPVPGATSSAATQDLQNNTVWEETLLDNLLHFAATPQGLLLLQQTGAINDSTFLALVNLLSSYHAVYELLGKQGIPNKPEYPLREMPTSIIDILDRIIIINSDAKIHSLFNFEQSHTFGLRLLCVMCCNLDTLLLLESQYRVSEILLQSQKDNVSDASVGQGKFIIDGLSVERNHILVRMNLIGGPSERFLPPRALQKGSDLYPWPMFSSYPLPKCYLLDVPKMPPCTQDTEINTFLTFSKNPEKQASWMETCRKQFCKAMTTRSMIMTSSVLADLLEKAVMNLSANTSECFFSLTEYKAVDSSVKNHNLSSLQHLGIKMTIRYGKYFNLLKDESEQDLCLLLKHCQKFLLQQQAKIKSPLRCLQGAYPGYDWFASSVFLIMSGEQERALTFLLRFSTLLVSAFLWPPRLHVSIHHPVEIAASGIHPMYSCTAHYVEMLLKAEVPLVFSAFRMSGFTPSQICQQWLGQCFWNYLDWPEICHYISACIVMGPDYQVYVCIAALKHLQQDILQHTQTQDLQVFLKEEPIHGFQVSNYLEYMEGLERRYRAVLLTDMRNIKLKLS